MPSVPPASSEQTAMRLSEVASRAVSSASRFSPASRNAFDQRQQRSWLMPSWRHSSAMLSSSSSPSSTIRTFSKTEHWRRVVLGGGRGRPLNGPSKSRTRPWVMSALGAKAENCRGVANVSFSPKAEIEGRAFDCAGSQLSAKSQMAPSCVAVVRPAWRSPETCGSTGPSGSPMQQRSLKRRTSG